MYVHDNLSISLNNVLSVLFNIFYKSFNDGTENDELLFPKS